MSIEGGVFLTADRWVEILQPEDRPINYLEIGVHSGVNLISVEKLYAKHPDSKLYAIDPWEDYEDYPEYKGQQDTTYARFNRHIRSFNLEPKVNVLRGYSNDILPTLENAFFDIIYIDGNHEPEYVLEDAVLAFRKLKVGGYLIFDDYGFGGPEGTSVGIDSFLSAYKKRIEVLTKKWSFCTGTGLAQVFLKKIR